MCSNDDRMCMSNQPRRSHVLTQQRRHHQPCSWHRSAAAMRSAFTRAFLGSTPKIRRRPESCAVIDLDPLAPRRARRDDIEVPHDNIDSDTRSLSSILECIPSSFKDSTIPSHARSVPSLHCGASACAARRGDGHVKLYSPDLGRAYPWWHAGDWDSAVTARVRMTRHTTRWPFIAWENCQTANMVRLAQGRRGNCQS
jgi:hypothetical protein